MHIDGEHDGDDDALILPPEEGEDAEVERPEDKPEGDVSEEDDGDLVLEIEGDAPENDTPAIRQIREELRRVQRERDELKRIGAPKPIEVGPKPTMESCGYDDVEYDRQYEQWRERSDKAARQTSEQQEHAEREVKQFEERRVTYKAQAQTLGIKDFQRAEDTVVAAIPVLMQNAIIRYADHPAKVVAALGHNPSALNRMAAITDPGEFIKELVKLEGKVQMTRRKPLTPDTPSRGTASLAPTSDKKREQLLKEARRTGDRTAIAKYDKAQAAKGSK